jgi:hypothetical protein
LLYYSLKNKKLHYIITWLLEDDAHLEELKLAEELNVEQGEDTEAVLQKKEAEEVPYPLQFLQCKRAKLNFNFAIIFLE